LAKLDNYVRQGVLLPLLGPAEDYWEKDI